MNHAEFTEACQARWPSKTKELLQDAAKACRKYQPADLDKILDYLVENHEGYFPKVPEINKAAKEVGIKIQYQQAKEYFFWHCRECGRFLPITAQGCWCQCGAPSLAWAIYVSNNDLDCHALNKQSGAYERTYQGKGKKEEIKVPIHAIERIVEKAITKEPWPEELF